MLRRIFWSPFPVFAVNSIWLSGVCEHNLYSPGFFLCNLPLPITLCAGYIHVQALILKKKVLKSLCEIITYEMELSYGTSIFRRETKFDKHDRFWTRNVSCPELRNVKVTNEFHWQLEYNPRVVKLFGMYCKI